MHCIWYITFSRIYHRNLSSPCLLVDITVPIRSCNCFFPLILGDPFFVPASVNKMRQNNTHHLEVELYSTGISLKILMLDQTLKHLLQVFQLSVLGVDSTSSQSQPELRLQDFSKEFISLCHTNWGRDNFHTQTGPNIHNKSKLTAIYATHIQIIIIHAFYLL